MASPLRPRSEWRGRVAIALRSGVGAVDPEIRVVGALDRLPEITGHPHVIILALGKAALGMARGAARALDSIASGIVVCPSPEPIAGLDVMAGNHPVPGPASFAAGRRLLATAAQTGKGDLALVLLSGGASALAEAPAPDWTERAIAETTRHLLASGEPIGSINRRRFAMSTIKNGGLTRAARPARVVTLAISDVPPGQAEMIGSGPSLGCDEFLVIADGGTAAGAAAGTLRDLGLRVFELPDYLDGPAAAAGRRLAADAKALEPGSALVAHGETTVQLDTPRHGGRNQELALAAAMEIAGTDLVIGSIGTDGVDGPTANAGAVVDGTTVARGSGVGLDAGHCLAAHDSATFLEAVGDVVVTGPTGTNVGDIVVAISAAA